ncbi:cysteine protease ATG4B [Planococcus citri]|uniref:cysteine protease ATG4B n=1 Tax=Planococcus citri TaxID=170843 RepID=UPI0031F7FAEC
MDLMFEAYLTHESTSQPEPDDIPHTKDPVWILGKKYNAIKELEEIRRDIRSRLWFSYRKGFVSIGDTGITSDKGWGCMLRCGQMVIAQALLFLHLGREWRWTPASKDETYLRIIRLFEDVRCVPYSIHQIALTGASEGKQVGEWFGPNTIAQVLKKLAAYDQWNSIVLHVALDNVLVTNEVKRLCRQTSRNDVDLFSESTSDKSKIKSNSPWKPLVLIIPLRLGITDINPIYFNAFKACFTFQQSLGIIGGKPNHALYFIGCVGNEVIFLDPHTTQPFGSVQYKQKEQERKTDCTYHCQNASRLPLVQMDPSVAACFLCRVESEFDSLCELIKENLLSTTNQPLIEICEERDHWRTTTNPQDSFNVLDLSDSSDDFEFLG